MQKVFSILAIAIVIAVTLQHGCNRSNPLELDRYPVAVGNSWDYSRTFYAIVYDTVNNDTTEYLITDSLHEEFEDIDTLAGWECYRLRHTLYEQGTAFDEYWWYAHPDSALLWIASCHDSELINFNGPILNIKLRLGDMIFNSPQELAQYLYSIRAVANVELRSDTTYYFPPRKLFIYPLSVGESWTSMTDPWLEEREAEAEDRISVPAGSFSTLRIKVDPEIFDSNALWHKWISEEGLIQDSLHIWGEVLDFGGHVIGYYDSDDIYELIDFDVE